MAKGKEGWGRLWANKKKSSDKAPGYTGTILWKGEELRLALWKNVEENGEVTLSVHLQEQRSKPDEPHRRPFGSDDDIGF